MTKVAEKQTILIVDDDPRSIRILADLLRMEYTIVVAKDGETALQIAISDKAPDLILLDVMMPKTDGYEVCRKLKAESQTNKIPIIFITSKDSEEDEVKGFEVGAVDYVTKPFRPVIVKARVNTHAMLKRQRDLLEKMSLLDGLTGISNRRKMNEYLVTAGEFVARDSSSLSLIMLDIDKFKEFNDYYGHYAGDICLTQIAKILSDNLKRKIDLVARYGGEEFACILPRSSHEFALSMGEALRSSIESMRIPHATSVVSPFVTISVGVATVNVIDHKEYPKNLITAADEAMYRAKQQGRNQVCGQELDKKDGENKCYL